MGPPTGSTAPLLFLIQKPSRSRNGILTFNLCGMDGLHDILPHKLELSYFLSLK